jgi:hypothetical protein
MGHVATIHYVVIVELVDFGILSTVIPNPLSPTEGDVMPPEVATPTDEQERKTEIEYFVNGERQTTHERAYSLGSS